MIKRPNRSLKKDLGVAGKTAKKAVKRIISAPSRYLDRVEKGMKATREARGQKIQKMMQSNGMERYERMKADSKIKPKRK